MVCSHFGGKKTFITTSNNFLANAWLDKYNDNGDLIYTSFEAGLNEQYYRHLLEFAECRREEKITLREVKRMLRQINEEWNSLHY